MSTSFDSSPGRAEAQPITRVRRTYGRPKAAQVDVATDSGDLHSSSSLDSIGASEPPATDISASTSLAFTTDDSDDDIFGHKRMLDEIDKRFASDSDGENDENAKPATKIRKEKQSNPLELFHEFGANIAANSHSERRQDADDKYPTLSLDNSPVMSRLKGKGVAKIVVDSEGSDDDAGALDKGITSSSSKGLLDIFGDTPKSCSSLTPPTSDIELSLDRMPTKKNKASRPSSSKRPHEKDDEEESRDIAVKRRKSKGLTKKELKETRINQAKLMSAQEIIPERKQRKLLSMASILPKLQPGYVSPTSDPIQDFSSSSSPNRAKWNAPALLKSPIVNNLASLNDVEDEALPDVSTVIQQIEAKKQEEKQKLELAAFKKKFLEKQAKEMSAKVMDGDAFDEEDDLEILEESSPIKKPSAKANNRLLPSAIAPLMRRRVTAPHQPRQILGDLECMELAARPVFGDKRRKSDMGLNSKELKMVMQSKMKAQSENLVKQKEDEWVKRGGKLKMRNETEPSTSKGSGSISAWLQSARDRAKEGLGVETEAEGDESDEEWKPEVVLDEEEENDENMAPVVHDSQSDGEDGTEQDENMPPRPRKVLPLRRPRRSGIVDSDDELDSKENNRRDLGRVLVPDTSFMEEADEQQGRRAGGLTFTEEESADDEDKENSMHLMYDNSEDKENKAVPRYMQSSPSRPTMRNVRSGFFEPDIFRRGLSMPLSPNDIDLDSPTRGKSTRSSSRALLDDPFVLQPLQRRRSNQSGTTHVTSAALEEPTYGALQPSALPKSGGFDDPFFSDEENAPINDENKPPVLLPAFDDSTFAGSSTSTTQNNFKPVEIGGMSQFFASSEDAGGFVNKMQKRGDSEELSLTLDVQLQPALDLDSQVLRKADAIFEKEQAFLVEEANQSRRDEPELYITETGMLTQTKPTDGTPLIYRRPPPTQMLAASSQRQVLARQASGPRQPLGTLSFSEHLEPSQNSPLRRLRKGKGRVSASDDDVAGTDVDMSPSPSPRKPTNAFSLMLQAAAEKERTKRRTEKRMKQSEFIEGEAQESDDDEMLGFKTTKKVDDEEEDGDDLDGEVAELLDNDDMDARTLALNEVKEKVLEQEMEDDAKLQKYHEDAIQGKFRHKRRSGGLALDESDSEDDEDARIRRKIHKKRKVDGDTLEDLATDEKTLAYYHGYQGDLHDEAISDFAYLNDGDDGFEDEEEQDENQPEDENANQTGFRGHAAFQERLQEAAAHKDASQEFDPENADWAEQHFSDDEDENLPMPIKEVQLPGKKVVPLRTEKKVLGEMDIGFGARRKLEEDPSYNNHLSAWAKEQASSRMTTGRGGVAVTGHGASASGASRKGKARAMPVDDKATNRRKPTKAPSMLAGVSERQSRFES